jgi:RNA polymerase sigma-70 factor (sigma-E family)
MSRWQPPPAYTEFVSARYGELFRFAYVLCGDEHRAADLVQDALERTALAWRRVENQDDPERYVRRVLVNLNVSRFRRLRRERLVADAPEIVHIDPPRGDDELWGLLAALPPRQRTVIVLRFYEDMTETQIATALGCSLGTVKSNSSRAIAKLRAALAPTNETVTS